jgi:hypothetical protein
MGPKSQDGAVRENVPKPELTPSIGELEAAGPVALSAAGLQRVMGGAGGSLSSGELLALQRTVGNQAVLRTLALGNAGQEPAVQREGTGIAEGERVKEYAEGAREVQSEWEKLSASERANKLGALANAALATVKVPPVTIAMVDLGSGSGAFNSGTWTLKIDKKIISKDSVTEAELAELSNTFYHEARHAEQFFRVARWMAGTHRSAKHIARYLAIPGRIAKVAVDEPLEPIGVLEGLLGEESERAAEIAEARRWMAVLSPTGRRRYGKVIAEMKAAEKAYLAAVDAYKASPTEENKEKIRKAKDTFRKKYRAYRRFADEKDAFKVGGDAEEAFKAAGSEGT